MQATVTNLQQLFIVKYLSLVYDGIARNTVPLVVVILSYFMSGLRVKSKDLILIVVTFVGVSLITIGYEKPKSVEQAVPFFAYFGCFAQPILMGWGIIIMSRTRGVHESTASCYMNLVMLVVTVVICAFFSQFPRLDHF